jgi:ATP-dependent RNA helicase DDX55/SPB4
MKAFPSYIQAYSKHQATFIFRMSELDIPSVAYSWGLLKLPRMPELKSREITWEDVPIDVSISLFALISVEYLRLCRPAKRTNPSDSIDKQSRKTKRYEN